VGGFCFVLGRLNSRKLASETQRVELGAIEPNKSIEFSRTDGVANAAALEEVERNYGGRLRHPGDQDETAGGRLNQSNSL
jgi:hypothetical protein